MAKETHINGLVAALILGKLLKTLQETGVLSDAQITDMADSVLLALEGFQAISGNPQAIEQARATVAMLLPRSSRST